MEIGQPKRTIIVAPLELPIPQRREAPVEEPTPVVAPQREPVLVPA